MGNYWHYNASASKLVSMFVFVALMHSAFTVYHDKYLWPFNMISTYARMKLYWYCFCYTTNFYTIFQISVSLVQYSNNNDDIELGL